MKKIITLIMMFVLSVGFLMAQGVFTYQAVVVDQDGNLVVNKTVDAEVTITYGTSGQYTQTLTGINTSLNGLALLSIGDNTDDDFTAIDWSTAQMKVDFTVTDNSVTVPAGVLEQVPAVPYALQSKGELTTQMIIDYVKDATMDDVRQILDAMDQGTPLLKDTLMATVIDTVKENYELAKLIFMHYVETATPMDLKILYDSLMSNTDVMEAIDTIGVHFLKQYKEDVYDVLRAYTLALTPTDVSNIWDSIPLNMRTYIFAQAIEYLETPMAKDSILIPVIMDYAQHITTDEFKMLVEAMENNPNAYNIMLDTFNLWMDQYFTTHYTGGNNVQEVVDSVINSDYYAQCTGTYGPVDICQLQTDLETLTANPCFTPDNLDPVYNAFMFTRNMTEQMYVGTLHYSGTEEFTPNLSSIRITSDDVVIPVGNNYVIQLDASNNLTVKLPFSLFEDYEDEHGDVTVFEIDLIITSTDCYPAGSELNVLGLYHGE